MARPVRWRDLLGGILSLVVIVGLSFAILAFGNVNSLHGKSVRLYAAVGEARGVLRGTEVWLYGKRVGLVEGVSFLPPSADTARRLLISMDVLEQYRHGIRKDAQVQIRAGTTLIGAPVVYISQGSAPAPIVASGDTIRSVPQNDFETMSSEFAGAAREVPAILGNLRVLSQQLKSTRGTLGAFGIEKGGPELDAAQAQLRSMSTKLQRPVGTVGRALNSRPDLMARAQRVLARADSVRTLLASGRGEVGRFRRDSTLLREVGALRDEIATVRALMASPNGNLGRFQADSAIWRALGGAQKEMSSLFTDVRRHPLRYVHF